jgi:hypothetical protein
MMEVSIKTAHIVLLSLLVPVPNLIAMGLILDDISA